MYALIPTFQLWHQVILGRNTRKKVGMLNTYVVFPPFFTQDCMLSLFLGSIITYELTIGSKYLFSPY